MCDQERKTDKQAAKARESNQQTDGRWKHVKSTDNVVLRVLPAI